MSTSEVKEIKEMRANLPSIVAFPSAAGSVFFSAIMRATSHLLFITKVAKFITISVSPGTIILEVVTSLATAYKIPPSDFISTCLAYC
jgi:hypothetical protein